MADSEEDFDDGDIKLNVNQLLAFQRDLKQERDLLKKTLLKIDDQVHRLQVEQLHLLGLMNRCLKRINEESPRNEPMSESNENPRRRSLDLAVAPALKYFEEENDDEDDEEDHII